MQDAPLTTQTIQARLQAAGFANAYQVRKAMVDLADAGCLLSVPVIHKVMNAGPGEAVLHESSLLRFQRFFQLIARSAC